MLLPRPLPLGERRNPAARIGLPPHRISLSRAVHASGGPLRRLKRLFYVTRPKLAELGDVDEPPRPLFVGAGEVDRGGDAPSGSLCRFVEDLGGPSGGLPSSMISIAPGLVAFWPADPRRVAASTGRGVSAQAGGGLPAVARVEFPGALVVLLSAPGCEVTLAEQRVCASSTRNARVFASSASFRWRP